MLYLFLFIFSASITQVDKTSNPPFITYNWYNIDVEEDFTLNDRFIELVGKGYYRTKKDNKMQILAFDTLPIVINIHEPTKDTLKIIEQHTYRAIPNPDFHKAWDSLQLGEMPLPLTEKQSRAFDAYDSYKLLKQTSPAFSVQSIYGEPFTEDSLLNKITLLNFWYYGCLPCMAEIPALNGVAEYYKNHPKVQLLSFFKDSIYVDEVGLPQFQSSMKIFKEGKVFSNKHHSVDFNFTHIPNGKKDCAAFNVKGYPTNLLIDHNGEIQEIFVGASLKDNEHLKKNLIRQIDHLLENIP